MAIINFKAFLEKKRNKTILASLALVTLIAILGTLVWVKLKTITVVIDGKPIKVITFSNTVDKALKDKDITVGKKDKIYPSLNAKIVNKDTVNIKRAVNIKVVVEGKETDVLTSEDTVEAMLKAEGITYNTQDKITPELNTSLNENMNVEIVKVETKTFKDSVPVEFKTVMKTDRGLSNTVKKTVQDGQNGEKQIITDVTYENGKEVSRKTVSEKVTKSPTDKIVVLGTFPDMPISRGGDPLPYGKSFKAKATAYSAIHGIGRTYTASGRLAVRNPDGYSTIAVDPSVIPLGTKVFVEGYGFAIAADTGTNIVGKTIDVFFDTYDESTNWAVKYVNVYILK